MDYDLLRPPRLGGSHQGRRHRPTANGPEHGGTRRAGRRLATGAATGTAHPCKMARNPAASTSNSHTDRPVTHARVRRDLATGKTFISADIACSAIRELSPSVTSGRTTGRQVRLPASRSSAGRSGRDEHRCVIGERRPATAVSPAGCPMSVWGDLRCSSQVRRTTGPPGRRSRAGRLREPARRCGIRGEPARTPRGGCHFFS